MPEVTVAHLAVSLLFLLAAALLGWLLRGDRCTREKIAVNAGWQEQLEGQQAEVHRLTHQNRKLMQRIGEIQASHKDARQRARELTETLKRAIDTRDELQRQAKDLQMRLREASLKQETLAAQIEDRDVRAEASARTLEDKDRKIFKLSSELSSWQSRLPPLIARFRERDREAQELAAELERSRRALAELEERLAADGTRIEPLARAMPGTALSASNERYEVAPETDRAASDDPTDHWLAPGRHNGSPYGQETAASPEGVAVAAAAVRDDLKRIKGVGPAIERTLNEFGFYRFEQLAAISEYDIDRLAARLKGLRSRIYREDWIGQARALQQAGGP